VGEGSFHGVLSLEGPKPLGVHRYCFASKSRML
jgi:hypothetical protein